MVASPSSGEGAGQRLGLFVDVQNVYYTTRQAFGRHFDYNAFWARFAAGHRIEVANAYAVERGDARQQQFQAILRGIGFSVKLKPFIQRSDGSAKGDWDVGIALDVIEAAPHLDHIVLVSGDGDFDILVERARCHHGVRVTVVGVESLTADSLIRAASDFVSIRDVLLL